MAQKIWHRAPKPIYDEAARKGFAVKKDGFPPLERFFLYATQEDEQSLYQAEAVTEVEFMGRVETFPVVGEIDWDLVP